MNSFHGNFAIKSDEKLVVDKYMRLNEIKTSKPIKSGKRKLDVSPKTPFEYLSMPTTSSSNKYVKNLSKDTSTAVMISSKTAKQSEMLPEKLLNEVLNGIAEIKSRMTFMEHKVDACTAALQALRAEQKRMMNVLAKQLNHDQYDDLDMEDDFTKDIEDSFPITNEQTLERFNLKFEDAKNVSIFVKHMSDLHIKDCDITDGRKLVRNFVDHFFDRKFMLQMNRTGIRRNVGPPKIPLEKYENILKTFHKCIIVGVPNFGYEGTRKALWRLCDTAMQRCRGTAASQGFEFEKYEEIHEDPLVKIERDELFDASNLESGDGNELTVINEYG